MPKKKKSNNKTKKTKTIKKGRNKKKNVLVTKILPRAKKLHKKNKISMQETVKQASSEYRNGKL